MRLFTRINALTHSSGRRAATASAAGCRDCEAELDHCHHTLVLHADGRAECEGVDSCGADEAGHELWLPCNELGCACTGEEHDLYLAA